jgi:CRISPR/Cas system endoribonuclease Cas6 (RAMP superfamily)
VTVVFIRGQTCGSTWHPSKLSGFAINALMQDEKLRMDLHPTTGFLGAATARLKGIKPGDVQASNLIKLKVSTCKHRARHPRT